MAKLTIYITDDLAEELKTRQINVSKVCQYALWDVLRLPTQRSRRSGKPYTWLTAEDVEWLIVQREHEERKLLLEQESEAEALP